MQATRANYFKPIAGAVVVVVASLAPLQLAAELTDASQDSANFTSEAYKFFESGETQLALEAFNKALEADASDMTARMGQAMVYQEQNRYEDAFKAYDLIVKSFPGHAYAWNGRGLAAFNMENFDEAVSSFQRATADQPINGFFYESLAWAHLCQGDYAEATSSAKQATLMYNQNGETAAYPLLITYVSQLQEGKVDDAKRTLGYALKNKPTNGEWPTPVFDYLSGQMDAHQLISFVTDTTEETEAHTYIGLKLRSMGEEKKAEKHLDWVAQHGDARVFEHTLARTIQASQKVALLAP